MKFKSWDLFVKGWNSSLQQAVAPGQMWNYSSLKIEADFDGCQVPSGGGATPGGNEAHPCRGVCVCVCVCLCVCVCVCCVCECVCVYCMLCECVCVVFIFLWLCVWAHVCMCVLCMCVYSVYACVCMCCVCLCVLCLSMCLSMCGMSVCVYVCGLFQVIREMRKITIIGNLYGWGITRGPVVS